jgi:hypothetical protein
MLSLMLRPIYLHNALDKRVGRLQTVVTGEKYNALKGVEPRTSSFQSVTSLTALS